MSTKYVLALDQGTTSSRAILFDNEQNIIAVQQREFEQIYPQQGWVEHNPMEIWSTQYGVMNEVVGSLLRKCGKSSPLPMPSVRLRQADCRTSLPIFMRIRIISFIPLRVKPRRRCKPGK